MKIRYAIVGVLLILLFVSIYMFVGSFNINKELKKKYDESLEIVKQEEINKDNYEKKVNELQNLKEKNKDKISKYDEVVKWNEEIKQYLD